MILNDIVQLVSCNMWNFSYVTCGKMFSVQHRNDHFA